MLKNNFCSKKNQLELFQKVLDVVSIDQKVITDPHLNRKRRSVIVTRKNDEPFGFTLQVKKKQKYQIILMMCKGEELKFADDDFFFFTNTFLIEE